MDSGFLETFAVESRIQKFFAFRIRNPTLWNPALGILDPRKQTFWNPESPGLRWNPESSTWDPESTSWYPESIEVESWIQYLRSRVYIMASGIQWGGILNQVPGIWSPQQGIWNTTLSQSISHGAKHLSSTKSLLRKNNLQGEKIYPSLNILNYFFYK